MARLSRSATFVLGKCTADVKTKVPEEDKEDFDRFCRKMGTTPAELLRDFILTKTRGIDVVRSLYESRVAVVTSLGPNEAPSGGSNG